MLTFTQSLPSLHHITRAVLIILSIYDVLISAAPSASRSIHSEKANYFLSCGIPSGTTISSDNQTWYSDEDDRFTSSKALASAAAMAESTIPSRCILCFSARIFNSTFTYSFPISPGPKLIRLHFCPVTYGITPPSKFFLSVLADGGTGPFTLLQNFSAPLHQGQNRVKPSSPGPMTTEEFLVSANTSCLNLTFFPATSESLAFINSIEIISAPDRLYNILDCIPDNQDSCDQIRYVNADLMGFSTQGAVALKTVVRLNVGGDDVAGDGDSGGMFRTWMSDQTYLAGDFAGAALDTTPADIKYTTVPEYTAPRTVYSTARAMGPDYEAILTWEIPVELGFDYLVRLHFCEIDHNIALVNQRVFSISINNQTAATGVDVIAFAGDWGVPWYSDYVITVYGMAKGNHAATQSTLPLQLALHPDTNDKPQYANAILNGVEIFKLSGWNRSLALPNLATRVPTPSSAAIPSPAVTSLESHQKKWSKRLKTTAIASTGGGFVMMFIVAIFCLRRTKRLPILSKEETGDSQNVESLLSHNGKNALQRYTYSDIKRMTDSFKQKLGEGGYGSVYKGKLQDGRSVAVKLLKKSQGDRTEFINEISSIIGTNHVNVISLIGLCFQGHKRALVYEFMPNGSLDKYIYGGLNEFHLESGMLLEIAIGIARGLEYLHRGCKTRVLHFDIKPHNILLDENFRHKISDFGLARPCQQKESRVTMSGARGTPGFIAPEVFRRGFGGVSHKSDVYSYGMLVLDMIGCRKNNTIISRTEEQTKSELYFPQWICKLETRAEENELSGILDDKEKQEQRKMVIVSLWCIQTNPSSRPSMSQVVAMLEGSLESLQIPPMPCLSSLPRSVPEHFSSTYSIKL